MGTGFYGSNDPTNSVKALKEDRSKGSGSRNDNAGAGLNEASSSASKGRDLPSIF